MSEDRVTKDQVEALAKKWGATIVDETRQPKSETEKILVVSQVVQDQNLQGV